MRILQKDWKNGKVKLVIESGDDLWYCYTIIDKGDLCTGDSEYKYKIPGSDKNVRKRVWVALKVEKTEFSQHTGQLRISGSVVDGSEEVPRGSHHGFDVSAGSQLAITKEWLDFHKEKLEEAVQSGGQKTLLVLFDRENALFALLKPNGHEVLLSLKGDVAKKALDEVKSGSFYQDIVHHLEEYVRRHGVQRIIAASPSFWKEYLRKVLPKELTRKVVFSPVSSVDESAITEVLRRPEVASALAGERAAREAAIVERCMAALAKDALVYGFDDVRGAVREGNLSELVVSEREIMKRRANDTFAELEKIMRAASEVGAKVHLISTSEKIDGLGGLAGVKRW